MAILVGTWRYWVNKGRYQLVIDGTGSVYGDAGWYFAVLGQYLAVLIGTWCRWVRIGGS